MKKLRVKDKNSRIVLKLDSCPALFVSKTWGPSHIEFYPIKLQNRYFYTLNNSNCFIYLFFLWKDPDEFEQIYEPLDVKSKKIHVVDSGLTFNLPYPLILRPQRGVDLIISFDFSARPSDSSPPFKVRRIYIAFRYLPHSLACLVDITWKFIVLSRTRMMQCIWSLGRKLIWDLGVNR